MEFLLERDMIDISTCCRRPLLPQQVNSTGGTTTHKKTSLFKAKEIEIKRGEQSPKYEESAGHYFSGSPS